MKKKSTICPHCGDAFKRPYNLTVHIEKQHRTNVEKVVCPYCPQKCSNISNLKVHIRRIHPNHGRLGRIQKAKLKYERVHRSKLVNGRFYEENSDSDDDHTNDERNTGSDSDESIKVRRNQNTNRINPFHSPSSIEMDDDSMSIAEDDQYSSPELIHAAVDNDGAREVSSHQLEQLFDSTKSDDNYDTGNSIESSNASQGIASHHLEQLFDSTQSDDNYVNLNDTAGEILISVQTVHTQHTDANNRKRHADQACTEQPRKRQRVMIVGTSKEIEKSYIRSAQEPRAEDIRPEKVLLFSYAAVKEHWISNRNYAYACDQLKSIRQDLLVGSPNNLIFL